MGQTIYEKTIDVKRGSLFRISGQHNAQHNAPSTAQFKVNSGPRDGDDGGRGGRGTFGLKGVTEFKANGEGTLLLIRENG